MLLRVVAFLVGLIAVIAGYVNYDSTVSSSTIPIILGGLVMLIGIFNLIPQIKRCSSCRKKIPYKAIRCHYCKSNQPPEDS